MRGCGWQGLIAVMGLMSACGGSVLAWNGAGWPELVRPTRICRLPPTTQDTTQHTTQDTTQENGVMLSAWEPDSTFLLAAPTESGNPVRDLERRVAELESQLQDQAIEKAAAKKKAVSRPTVKLGGRLATDFVLFNQSPANMAEYGDIQDGCEFRQIRLKGSGKYQNVDYKVEVDFSGIAPRAIAEPGRLLNVSCRDVYLTVNELPWLRHVRIGHFKEPCSLEELISRLHITYMERPVGTNAFAPQRNIGAMMFDHSWDKEMTWAIGVFRANTPSTPPIRQDDDGGAAMTCRLTWLPWCDDESVNRRLLHTGLSYSYRDSDDGQVRFRAYPNARMAPYMVDTGNILDVESWQICGAEMAFVHESFSVQSEYMATWVHRPQLGDRSFHGAYISASYFLTGESRNYLRSRGIFGRLEPFGNFFRVRGGDGRIITGLGAWEIAYRYSYVYLNDEDISGGCASDNVVGLNWYLNPYTRVMWDYTNSLITPDTSPKNTINCFQVRVQIDF